MKKVFTVIAAALVAITAAADEGMWLLPLLQKMKILLYVWRFRRRDASFPRMKYIASTILR